MATKTRGLITQRIFDPLGRRILIADSLPCERWFSCGVNRLQIGQFGAE
jgi:hypothetical protein